MHGFNEAPAERGGERRPFRQRIVAELASMRPPLNAGENDVDGRSQHRRDRRFNEAPAERGGEPQTLVASAR